MTGTNVMLIGISLSRTIQSYRRAMRHTLMIGGKVRILLLDPETLDPRAQGETLHVRNRINNSLQELAVAKTEFEMLEVRLMVNEPACGMNLIDADSPAGLIVVQHREFDPVGEASPIIALEQKDTPWYIHFRNEAERIWEASMEWPQAGNWVERRRGRSPFVADFGTDHIAAIGNCRSALITGVARNELIRSNFQVFQRALQRGCKLRFVLIDPESPAVEIAADRYYADRSPENLQNRIRQSTELLTDLRERTDGDLELRYTSCAIAMGCIATDTSQGGNPGALFLEYYTHQVANEPKLILRPGDEPEFHSLLREAETIWSLARTVGPGQTTTP